MDAKPQRPRALRVHDENMALPTLPAKTLHHRTKSVPAFSAYVKDSRKPNLPSNDAPVIKKVLGQANPNAKVHHNSKDDSMVSKEGIKAQKESAFAALKTKWGAIKEEMSPQPVDLVAGPLSRPALRPQTIRTVTAPVVTLPIQPAAVALPKVAIVPKKSMKVMKDEVVVTLPGDAVAVNADSSSAIDTHDILAIETNTKQAVTEQTPANDDLHAAAQAALPPTQKPQSSADKEYIIELEKQAEYFEAQEYHNTGIAPAYAPVTTMSAQHTHQPKFEFCDTTDPNTAGILYECADIGVYGFTTLFVPKPDHKAKVEVDAAKRYVEALRTPEDIDDEAWDTSMVAEYGDEIFEYMRKLENRMLPDARYMDIQTEIQWSMRAVLVDWVVQVHQRFSLLPETLFLAVNYIDRFLSHKVVSLGKLQLVGATALFIAAKFEEVNCPTLQEVIYMVDGGYTMDELLKAERFMLSMLQFDLGWPGPMSFLRRVSKADDYDLETRTLAKYFLEVTIMDERFIGCTPSYLAAGAHCLARLMLHKGDWTVAHVAYSEYTFNQLRPLLMGIVACCDNPRRHHMSVFEKYTDKRYKCASPFVEAEVLKGFCVPGPLGIRPSYSVIPSMAMAAPVLTSFT